MPVRIDKVMIHHFRRFHDLTLEFPKPITLIGGTNGTSKSTFLGMLGQPLGFPKRNKKSAYTDNYDGLDIASFPAAIVSQNFATKYSEVFRMSRKFDNPPDNEPYKYTLFLSGDCIDPQNKIKKQGLLVRSEPRTSTATEIRFVAGPGISNKKGEGNFPHPVIYLGLNRLTPLALCEHVSLDSNTIRLSDVEKSFMSNCYCNIMTIIDDPLQPQLVKTDIKNKGDFFGPRGTDFDAESCSAGQDNLGHILTSLIAFQRLKKHLGSKYQGGVLLIDEIDATLHPVAQEKLIEILLAQAKELDLQIIATTHSLYLFRQIMRSGLKKDIGMIFLEHASRQRIITREFDSYDEIENWLNHLSHPLQRRKKTQKIPVLREDHTTWDFFKCLIGSKICKCLQEDIQPFGAGTLGHLASINELQNFIFVVDGDKAGSDTLCPNRKNMLQLPGNTFPENLLYDYLKCLPADDPFFRDHSQKVIFRDHIVKPGTQREAKNSVKSWYRKFKPHFGTNAKQAYSRWIEDHKSEAHEFCIQFSKILDRIAKVRGIDIPIPVMNELKTMHAPVFS